MSTFPRHTRYQAAVMVGSQILLIRHEEHHNGRTYWLLPGGGREDGESEEECVIREIREETGLEVRVERLLVERDSTHPNQVYAHYKTYLCTPISGEAQPGYEPEFEASALYKIAEVRWVELWDQSSWDPLLLEDAITTTNLGYIQKSLKG